jgi:hypothetical protein
MAPKRVLHICEVCGRRCFSGIELWHRDPKTDTWAFKCHLCLKKDLKESKRAPKLGDLAQP